MKQSHVPHRRRRQRRIGSLVLGIVVLGPVLWQRLRLIETEAVQHRLKAWGTRWRTWRGRHR